MIYYLRLFLKFFIGYLLLGSVLMVFELPNLGVVLSILAETPVSGYYVLVTRAELLSYPQPTQWGQLPVWDARRIGELYWLGACMNVIMALYALAAAVLPLTVVGSTLLLNSTIGGNIYLHAVVNAFSLVLLCITAIPSLWILLFLQPTAVVRFAQTNRFKDAFEVAPLTKIALQTCRFAIIGALIMMAAYALNIASSLLIPETILLSEPTIEFAGVIFAFKFFARSYQKKLAQGNSCHCRTERIEEVVDKEIGD